MMTHCGVCVRRSGWLQGLGVFMECVAQNETLTVLDISKNMFKVLPLDIFTHESRPRGSFILPET